jgi:hypothetical protein
MAVTMRSLSGEQAILTSRKQVVTAQIQEFFRQGQTLLDYIQTGVRQHYGLSNEKLVEFGIQPLRTKARLKLEPPPPPGTETVAPDPEK